MIVRISKDWDDPNFLRQTPGGLGIWDDFQFTTESVFFCDVLVVLNTPPKNIFISCRKGGKWLMSQEPPHEFYLSQTKAYKYFDRIYAFWNEDDIKASKILHDQTCLPWHVGKSFDELKILRYCDISKKDEISWITSNLNSRPGHFLRLNFLDFLNQKKFKFSLFGRGFEPIEDKFNGIAPYKYSIAIENFACNDYWTEKIADCFLSWTMPIYYGCTNIAKYFPKESMILIDPTNPVKALEIIQSATANDLWQKNLEFIREARELILNKYQFFPSISNRIRKANLIKGKRVYFIPKIN